MIPDLAEILDLSLHLDTHKDVRPAARLILVGHLQSVTLWASGATQQGVEEDHPAAQRRAQDLECEAAVAVSHRRDGTD